MRRVARRWAVVFGCWCLLAGASSAIVRADDASDATRIAEMLRATDPLVRMRGETMLLERVRAGGDLPGFFRLLANALGPRADFTETPNSLRTTIVVYDVRDLVSVGRTFEDLEAEVRRAASNARIDRMRQSLLVRATDEEHVRIREALERLRVSRPSAPQPPSPEPPAPEPPKPTPQPPSPTDHRKAEIEVRLLQVPAAEVASLGDGGARVREIDEATAKSIEGRFADARRIAVPRIAASVGQEASVFVGEEVAYRKDVRLAAGGGWSILEGRIKTGTRITVTPSVAGDRLRLPMTFAVTTVARPIPVIRLKPAPDAQEVEIDAPQWTTLSETLDVPLPAAGGRALVHLPNLSGDATTSLIAIVSASVTAE